MSLKDEIIGVRHEIALPNRRLKTEASKQLQADVDNFLANGGTIKQIEPSTRTAPTKSVKITLGIDNYIVWQERQKVLDAMFNQRITNNALSKKLGVKLSVLGNWLSGRKIPDSLERKNIYDALGLYRF